MTVREPVVPTSDTARRPDRGGALSFSAVAAIFATLLVLGVGLAFVIHRSYVGFTRVAAYHVPPDTSLVVRWDVEKISLFEPTRRYLLPLFDYPDVAPAPAAKPAKNVAPPPKTRRDRFADRSGSMLGRDLREVVALFGPGEGDWAIALAGSFAPGDLVAAVEQTLREEGRPWRVLAPGRLIAPGGTALGRAEDGVVVVASSSERLDAVLGTHEPLPEVPRVGAGALRLRATPTGLPRDVTEALGSLGAVTEVTGSARWGTPLPVDLELRFAGPPPADATARIRTLAGRLLGDDLPRLEREAARISVQPAGNEALRVSVLLDDIALERLAKLTATTVERSLGPRAGATNGL
jgi:hypothetical protein